MDLVETLHEVSARVVEDQASRMLLTVVPSAVTKFLYQESFRREIEVKPLVRIFVFWWENMRNL